MTLEAWLEDHKEAKCTNCVHLDNGKCEVSQFVFIEDKTPESIFCAMWERRKAA